MWKVKLWDGTRLEQSYKTRTEGIDAAKMALKDWMNDGDGYHVHSALQEDVAWIWVIDSTEGDTDAMARVYR